MVATFLITSGFCRSMNIITDFHLSLSTDDILRGQGLNPELIHTRKLPLLEAASGRALVVMTCSIPRL